MRYWLVLFLLLALVGCHKDKPAVSKQQRQERQSFDLPEDAPIENHQLKVLRDARQLRDDSNKQLQEQQKEVDQDEQQPPAPPDDQQ